MSHFYDSTFVLLIKKHFFVKKQRKLLSVFAKFEGENFKILNVAQKFFLGVRTSKPVRN